MSGDQCHPAVDAEVKRWLEWDRNESTRRAIVEMSQRGEWAQLQRILCHRMTFGTAGLRAAMGPGNARMNDLTIIQTAQGLAAYLGQTFSYDELRTRGVLLGYDARHNSRRFAELSANVMTRAGIRCYLFGRITPTPFVPFGVRLLRCVAGVMVTASHNPKDDNGYKVYWDNGAQILSPHDHGISEAIQANVQPRSSSWLPLPPGCAEDPLEAVEGAYYGALSRLCQAKEANCATSLRITYTALHGVGARYALKALECFGFARDTHVFCVAQQLEPDPDFPTVAFPNPEEGKSALALSMQAGDVSHSRLILANDPDADRLGVVEKQADGTWHVFNGNQIGALLGWWAIRSARLSNTLDSSCYFISSAVSSTILASMAAKENIQFRDTLTGFKWMGTLAEQLQREGKGRVLLAYEEAIGFMYGTQVFDKDGISAAAVLAEMAAFLYREEGGKRFTELLHEIYGRYGYHFSSNSYVISRDAAQTAKMFASLRTLDGGGYPKAVAGAKVTAIRDLMVGLDTRQKDQRATLPVSSTSPMITFWFDNGVVMTFRSSGTEPKLKWYAEMVADKPGMQSALDAFVTEAVSLLLRPREFGFQARL